MEQSFKTLYEELHVIWDEYGIPYNKRKKLKLFPTGPECEFNGKKIPTLVQWSPSGSITTDILVDCLATLDHYSVFNRSSGLKPFLLLDGHSSQFKLPFLQ